MGTPPPIYFMVVHVQFLVSCNFCVYRYEIRILEAKNSDNLMSATINGSDNGEYGFPYWADKTKGTQKGYKVKTKLYSMLVHNIGVYTYVLNAHLPGGAGHVF